MEESKPSVEELKKLLDWWITRCKALEKENEILKEKVSAFYGY